MNQIILPRRRFLLGMGTLFAAPAVIKASSLMPVRAWRRLSVQRALTQFANAYIQDIYLRDGCVDIHFVPVDPDTVTFIEFGRPATCNSHALAKL